MSQITIADVSVGDTLPVMEKAATETQLFLYSAASHNPHRIHYDREYAGVEGHADLLVHGPLQGSWLTQFLTDWAGPGGRLLNVNWQNRASAYPNEVVTFHGTVTAVDPDNGIVDLDVEERSPDGRVIMPGTARVSLPGGAA